MRTCGLGRFPLDQREAGAQRSWKADNIVRDLRAEGRLKALPIAATDEKKGTLVTKEGLELREYGRTCTWVPVGALRDGAIRYLGSSSHSGHIELKALFVLVDDVWHNVQTGAVEPNDEHPAEAGR